MSARDSEGAHALPWGRTQPVVTRANDSAVPPLVELCLDRLACSLDSLHDVSPIREERLTLALLHRIISAGRLDFRLARVFQQCGHPEIEAALSHANLLDALPGPTDPKMAFSGVFRKW